MANHRTTPAYQLEQQRKRQQLEQERMRKMQTNATQLAQQRRLQEQQRIRQNQNNANTQNKKQLSPEELEVQRKEKALKARKKFKQGILQDFTPSSGQRQGAMEKAEHLAGLTAEGVSGEIGINLIIFMFEALGNTPWWVQTLQLQESLVKELESLYSDKPERICYLPDDNGVFPEIYPTDTQGKVDFSRSPLARENVTPFAIRANGYVPQPSILEGFLTACDFHCERMSGANSLSPDQKARMYNIVGESKKEKKEKEQKNGEDENEVRSNTASINAMRNRMSAKR